MKKSSLDNSRDPPRGPSGRIVLATRLSKSQVDITENICRHILRVSQRTGVEKSSCFLNVSRALNETIECMVVSIKNGEDQPMPIPSAIGACAREAAWHDLPLELLMRSVIRVHTVLDEVLYEETVDLPAEVQRHALMLERALIDRLSGVLVREYREEQRRAGTSTEQRNRTLVERVLSGIWVGAKVLDYPLGGWHVGLVATGIGAAAIVRSFGRETGETVLMVLGEEGCVWAWIGSQREFARDRLVEVIAKINPADVRLSLGEPAHGIAGYCSTHAQARAASVVASQGPPGVTFFASVALEAMALQAPEAAQSLHSAYLKPLTGPAESKLRETLVAYFATQRNISSAATLLGVSRRTIENRLRSIEARLGRPIHGCGAELEVALRLDRLLG
jgi:hypothetical protein